MRQRVSERILRIWFRSIMGRFFCETRIPKVKRVGICKLNNPAESGINDTMFRNEVN
jgi:hypothetical protein